MLSLLAYFPFLAVALLVQWESRHRVVRWLVYGAILSIDALAIVGGLSALLIGLSPALQGVLIAEQPALGAADWSGFGLALVITGAVSPVFLMPPVRRGLARLIPIDPQSGVHATALSLAVLVMGLNLSQLPLIGGLEAVAASAGQAAFVDLLFSNLPIGLFALVGVGMFVRRTPRETWQRLGLQRLTWRQVGLTVVLAAGILILYYGVDWVWLQVDPVSYEMMDALSEVLFGGVAGLWKAVLLSVVAAVTEELFFRGAVQPRFGFWLTALFFTAAHVQYGLTLAAVEVLVGALVLGWLRRRAGTGACILLHLLYDVGALFLFPLLP